MPMAPASATASGRLPLAVEFGVAAVRMSADPARPALGLPLPHLAGAAAETLFTAAAPLGAREGFQLFAVDELRLGWAVQPVGRDLAGATRDLYRRLLAAADGQHPCRIWNYVPQINAEVAGLENYRAFNAGRAQAFRTALGEGHARALPAASAVGCGGDQLAVLFVAGPSELRHLENPEQVPAYRYPSEHGPLPPSFARATVTRWGRHALTFISGTAAIKGHASIAADCLADQIACTLDNLRLISRTAGLGDRLGAGSGAARHFKVYLRHPADLAAAQAALAGSLLGPEDRVVWLQADLCRSELAIEIEATVIGG
jgi:hypothetical protein